MSFYVKPEYAGTAHRASERTPENAYPRSPLQLSGRRSYSPGLGRWLSRDPIGEEGAINLYCFAHNNAIRYVDRLGLSISPAPDPDPPVFPDDPLAEGASRSPELPPDVPGEEELAESTPCEAAGGTSLNGKCCCGGTEMAPASEYCCPVEGGEEVRDASAGQSVAQFCKIKMRGAVLAPLRAFSHCYIETTSGEKLGWWPINRGGYGKGEVVEGSENTQWERFGAVPRCKDIVVNLGCSKRCKCTADCLKDEMGRAGLYGIIGPGANCCEKIRTAVRACGCKVQR